MSAIRYRLVPTTIGPYTSWDIQKKDWFWRTVGFADSQEKAELVLKHMEQEPLYYVGNGTGK